MCGIAGKLLSDREGRVSRNEIVRMITPITHRGPDAEGIYLDRHVGLGHRRLSIIDLASGDQPMSNEDGSLWIIFNGEIYNYKALQKELISRGHHLKTQSDTEVIVHLYEDLGTECVTALRGMFAFAIWDSRNETLFLARDRMGIKPLYYCQTAQAFYFASEIKSILADPAVPRQVCLTAVRRFFSFHYLSGEETLVQKVYKLLPGYSLSVQHSGLRKRQYWDLQFSEPVPQISFRDAADQLHQLLSDTVRDHMISDVPVGILLSGGVDSSAVLSFAVRETGKKVKTFTVGFDGRGIVDERPYARLASRKFGSDHFETTINAEQFWDFLPSYVWHMEEPVHEPPAVALYYVSKLARAHVKVLLSGEGGDEAFAGYPNYPNTLKLDRFTGFLGYLARFPGVCLSMTGCLLGDERLMHYGNAAGKSLNQYYYSRASSPVSFFNRNAGQIFTSDFLRETREVIPAEELGLLLEAAPNASLLHRMLYVDSKTWLPDDLLIKADKITMANSIELRVPLLDHKILEFAASLPPGFKVQGSSTKRILKEAFSQELPSEILKRKKAGFPVPYGSWLRNELRGKVEGLVYSTDAHILNYIQPGALKGILQGNLHQGTQSRELFCLLVLELLQRSNLFRAPLPATS